MKKKSKKPGVPLRYMLRPLLYRLFGPLLPTLVGNSAYQLWLTPLKFNPPEAEQNFANKAKKSTLSFEGLNIRLWSWGEGPVVLFIHGWAGRGTQIAAFIDPLVAAGFQVMSLDLPAHGESEGKQTNLPQISKILGEVCKQIENLHSVITHSFGGMIFSHFYKPDLGLQKIIMFCAPATLHTPLNHFKRSLKLSDKTMDVCIRNLKHEFGENVFDKASVEDKVHQFRQPFMIVHDEQDDVVPIKEAHAIAMNTPNCTLLTTQHLGHHRILKDPNVIQNVIAFIRAP